MLFSSLFKKNKKNTQHYFGIFLQSTKATGFLYEITDNTISIKAKDTVPYTNSWEEIIDDVDTLLSSLEEETKIHADKTIFFLYSTYIDEKTHEIKNPYKKTIKNIIKELDLEPLGYIECYEAIREYLEHQHEGPFNGTIIEIDTTHTAAFVFKGGKNVFIRESARTQNPGDDISMIFSHKDDHILLPSRMIIYGAINSEELRNQIRDYTWDESSFVQLPRIEFFEDKELFEALSQTFLHQIIQEDTLAGEELQQESKPKEEELQQDERDKTEDKHNLSHTSEPDEKEKETQQEKSEQAEIMGFVIGQDISEIEAEKKIKEAETDSSEKLGFHIQEDAFEDSDKEKTDKPPAGAFLKQIKIPSISLPNISFILPKRVPTGMIIAWTIVLLLIGGIAFAVEYFFHKVTISVSFPTETITEEMSFSIPIGTETQGITIIEHALTRDVSASKTATGTKEVGEKATGSVLLHNFDEEATTIAAGTTLSVDGLSFTLNEAAAIPASKEGQDSSGVVKQPGKVQASVTANDIGSEYNIETGNRMNIGDLSSSVYFALSDGEFTGGSKKDVTIVSQADHTNLEEQIEKQAQKIDTKKIIKDIPEGYTIIEKLTSKEIGTLEFSKPVGTETNEVSLQATLEINVYTYSEKELKNALVKKIKPEITEDYTIKTDNITYDIQSVSLKKSENENNEDEKKIIDMKILTDADAVEKMDTKKLRNDITGKFIQDVDFILKKRYGIKEYEIESESEYLVIFTKWLPFFEQNIEIKEMKKEPADDKSDQ